MSGSLKNIRFKTASCQVMSIEHISRVLVEWSIEPTIQDLTALRFFVDRGESPNDMMPLSIGQSAYLPMEYMDLTPKMIDLQKVYYYRIRAVEYQEGLPVQTFQTQPFTWETDLDLVGLYVVEEHLFAHRYVYGVPAVIFKRIKDADYCPECFDPVLKRITKSRCTTCYGTGKRGGYHPFMETWMDFNPDPKTSNVPEWGEKQPSQTDIQFTNYPVLIVGDIIVEVQPNTYWKVANVRMTEKRRSITLQIARLDAVNRSDIEYQLGIPDEVRRRLVRELEAVRKEREF